MSTAGEAAINADGSTTFNDDTNTTSSSGGSGGSSGGDYDGIPGGDYATDEPSADAFFVNDDNVISKGRVDPALYLALAVLFLGVLFIYIQLRNKRKNADVDDFFANLDGDKFDLKLPPAVDEYYEVKTRCEGEGWEPGLPPPPPPPGGGQPQQPSTHHRLLAQALMKRCIADIPIVSHIQRESAGMNKLYSQSMCSVKQWKSYEAAEAMVSAEVEEVRAEADEIEPGWSNVSLVDLFVVRSFFRSFVLSLLLLFVCVLLRVRLSHIYILFLSPFNRALPIQGRMETGNAISQHVKTERGATKGTTNGSREGHRR